MFSKAGPEAFPPSPSPSPSPTSAIGQAELDELLVPFDDIMAEELPNKLPPSRGNLDHYIPYYYSQSFLISCLLLVAIWIITSHTTILQVDPKEVTEPLINPPNTDKCSDENSDKDYVPGDSSSDEWVTDDDMPELPCCAPAKARSTAFSSLCR